MTKVVIEEECIGCYGTGTVQQGKIEVPCPLCQGEGAEHKGKLKLTYKDNFR